MTAQMHDSILLNDQKFSIVGVNGRELFNPVGFGLRPFSTATSCWRGYMCEYKTDFDQLLLNTLQVNHEQQGPAIQGVAPSFGKGMFNNVYNHLSLPIDFSGEILAGEKFIRELYVHMGFQPAWKYETVYELVVSHGVILETKDVSKPMAGLRQQMTRRPPDSLEM
jgi:hypothetical protein